MNYSPDPVLAGFDSLTLSFPDDYEGPVVATLVRRQATPCAGKAVLYLHGFNDYFFQAHLADQYLAHGFNFYALDLRKHGRSLLDFQRPNFCRDIREYYADISAAIEIIMEAENHPFLLLNGHSNGGLIAALYAEEGRYKDRISALFLNSPFFAFRTNPSEKLLIALLARLGRVWPFGLIRRRFLPTYTMSIHRDYFGEWDFDSRLKPPEGYPLYFGWFRAISQAQQRLQQGLHLHIPILIMHAEQSIRSRRWSEALLAADAVLNVDDMRRYGPGLGPQTTLMAIRDGMHDLVLSRPAVRARVFARLFGWVNQIAEREREPR